MPRPHRIAYGSGRDWSFTGVGDIGTKAHVRRGRRLLAAAIVALLALTVGAAPQAAVPSKEAQGDPGVGSAWTTGAKQGVGTSTSLESKVWFALGQGITHEVYYPQLDVPNVQDLQLIVTDGSSFFDLERDATKQEVNCSIPVRSPTSRSTKQNPAATGSPRRTSPTRTGRHCLSRCASRR